MIRGLPIPQKRLVVRQRGSGLKSAISSLGRYIRPTVKTIARNIAPKLTKKIKKTGSKLITKGAEMLTNLAKAKMGAREGGSIANNVLIKPLFEDTLLV